MNAPSQYDLVTEYLARLQVGLLRLPAKEREEAYRELAQHVEALVADAADAGGDQEEAVRKALDKFGEPEKIGRKVANDYWRKELRDGAIFRMICSPNTVSIVNAFTWFGVAVALNFGESRPILPLPYLLPLVALCGVPLGICTGAIWAQRKLDPQSDPRRKSRAMRWAERHTIAFFAGLSILALLFLIYVLTFRQAHVLGHMAPYYAAILLTDSVVAMLAHQAFMRRRWSVRSK